MATCFNPNAFSVNGMGIPVQGRPQSTERQQLEDTLALLRNSLRMMEDEPDLAAEYAEVRRQVRLIEATLEGTPDVQRCLEDEPVAAGTCPVCGLDLTMFPHDEETCREWFLEDYRDADETRADLWQF